MLAVDDEDNAASETSEKVRVGGQAERPGSASRPLGFVVVALR